MNRRREAPLTLDSCPVEQFDDGCQFQSLQEDAESGERTGVLTVVAGSSVPAERVTSALLVDCLLLSGSVHTTGGEVAAPAYWEATIEQCGVITAGSNGARLLVWSSDPPNAPVQPSETARASLSEAEMHDLATIPWQPVFFQDGSATNYEAKTLRRGSRSGWTTWLMRLPPGWVGRGWKRGQPGGDELFILSGDWQVDRDEPVLLIAGSYYCSPDRLIDGGLKDRSEHGCEVIRWTRNTPHLLLPPERLR